MLRSTTLGMFVIWLAIAAVSQAETPKFPFEDGDRIVLLGNTFAERMGETGYFETLLLGTLPEQRLAVWNLGWAGDTPTKQPRPLNFGPLEKHLRDRQADVIFLCFGMNESFAGESGRAAFENNLREFIRSLAKQQFNGRAAPRLVLVSPIAHEQLPGDLPNAAAHNRQLRAYRDTMRQVAESERVFFVDLFEPTLERMQDDDMPLTSNGIHLSEYGYWLVAQFMLDELGYPIRGEAETVTVPGNSPAGQSIALPKTAIKVVLPPPPQGIKLAETVAQRMPRLSVAGLPQGRYTLEIEGVASVTASNQAWARGVPIASGAAERLRKAVVAKNEEFFYRWRALNGEYIYGRRAKPYGVVSFPPELKKMDALIAQRQQAVWRIADSSAGQAMRLVPAED